MAKRFMIFSGCFRLLFLPRDPAEVGQVFVDVDRSLDAVDQGEAAPQLEELGRAGPFERAVELLGAVGLRRLDEEVGLGPLLPLVEVLAGVDLGDLRVELRSSRSSGSGLRRSAG